MVIIDIVQLNNSKQKMRRKNLWRTAIGNNTWIMKQCWRPTQSRVVCGFSLWPYPERGEQRWRESAISIKYSTYICCALRSQSEFRTFHSSPRQLITISRVFLGFFFFWGYFLVILPHSEGLLSLLGFGALGLFSQVLSPCIKAYVSKKGFECILGWACPVLSASRAVYTVPGSQQATGNNVWGVEATQWALVIRESHCHIGEETRKILPG